MGNSNEIKFDFNNIDEAIIELQNIRDRAVTCSAMKFNMPLSKGDAKDVLLEAHDAMTSFSQTVAIMLKEMIDDLTYSKNTMKQTDENLARNMM